jgi:aspartyl aminopeptidase
MLVSASIQLHVQSIKYQKIEAGFREISAREEKNEISGRILLTRNENDLILKYFRKQGE